MNDDKMIFSRHTAYLVAFLEAPPGYQGLMPVVTRVGIFSSNSRNLTLPREVMAVDILHTEGSSYQKAVDNLRELIHDLADIAPAYGWIDQWLSMEDTYEGSVQARKMYAEHVVNVSGTVQCELNG